MNLSNLSEILPFALWPLIFYIPLVLFSFYKKYKWLFAICLFFGSLQLISSFWLLGGTPQGYEAYLIGDKNTMLFSLLAQVICIIFTFSAFVISFRKKKRKSKKD